MGSMERIIKFRYTRSEMLELNSSSPVDDNVVDVADGDKNPHEELPGRDEVAGGMAYNYVPKRPRTHRVVVGILTADPQYDVYYIRSTEMIADEKSLGAGDNLCSTKMIADGNNLGAEDGGDNLCGTQMMVDGNNSRKCRRDNLCSTKMIADGNNLGARNNLCSTKMIADGNNLGAEDGGDNLCGTEMMVDGNNSRKCRKRSRDEDYMVSGDDGWEEESSNKKKRKNVEKRTVAFRKNQIQLQNYPPSELPQNLRDYISRFSLEAPPLFVAQKVLYPSDIRRGQNRLSLPAKIISTDFFANCVTDTEKESINRKSRVEVSLVDNKMHEYHTMNLAKWEMNSSSNYVLITAWNNVVQDNKLEEAVLQKDGNEDTVVVMKEDEKVKSDVVVQVWCFRNQARLWFALNIQAMTERTSTGRTKGGREIVV